MKDFYFYNSEDIKDFLKNNKWLIHSLILDAIKKSKEEQLESIVVFRIINPITDFTMINKLDRGNWVKSLNKCLNYYEFVEEYEKCEEITKLINEIKDDNSRTNSGEKEN